MAGRHPAHQRHGLPGHPQPAHHHALYHNNRNGTFTDVTRRAGLDVEMYAWAAVGDYNNDGFQTSTSPACQNRLFRNTGKGSFVD